MGRVRQWTWRRLGVVATEKEAFWSLLSTVGLLMSNKYLKTLQISPENTFRIRKSTFYMSRHKPKTEN